MIGKRIGRIWLLVLPAFYSCAQAGQERYDYDPLGRLVRFINPAGQVTEYVYDGVGNIQAVRQVQARVPQVSGVAPGTVRRGATVAVLVSGSGLLGTTIAAGVPGMQIAGLRADETRVSFDLRVDASVPLGPQPFTLTNASGSAGFSLTVKPVLPLIVANPGTAVLAPGGQTLEVAVTLSSPDGEAHHLALGISNPAVASASLAAIDFPAGQTQASLTLTSGAIGTSVLSLDSATLAAAKVGIFVNGDEGPGERLRVSAQVGVVREPRALAEPTGPFTAAPVGLVREPAALAQPLGPYTAPAVGIVREPAALAQPMGPYTSPAVGLVREPLGLAQPTGPFVSPAVGVDKALP